MRRRLSVVEYNLKCDMHNGLQPSVTAADVVIGGAGFETTECKLRLEILPLSVNVTFLGSGVSVADGPSVHEPLGSHRAISVLASNDPSHTSVSKYACREV